MKTQTQIIAEFAKMQLAIANEFNGICVVESYGSNDYWVVTLHRTTFNADSKIKTKDAVTWEHFHNQNENDEARNEASLAEFKRKFNLK